MNIPSNQDFALEVRSDRLNTLWHVTLIGSLTALWIVLVVATIERANVSFWAAALITLVIGCLVTGSLLKKKRFVSAVWAYSLSGILAASLGLMVIDSEVSQYVPFAFPLIIFMAGLLLPPGSTLMMSVLAVCATVLAPVVVGQPIVIATHQAFAIILTFISAVLAAQVTGELFEVTEWALLNFRKERNAATELYESRQAVERSFMRTQALSEQLQATNKELENARSAAEEAKHFRGQFLANMSHELRTPLNAIIGFSETMLKFPTMYDDVPLPKTYEGDLHQIYNSGRTLLNLINDILDLSKVDAGKLEIRMERVDLEMIFKSSMSTAVGLIGSKPITITSDIPSSLPPVYADSSRVRQVLLNLYSNAAKFTDSGTITLRAREIDDSVEISIQDTGVGINATDLEIIFEEFMQAESHGRDPRSGAGLGLAIARQLLTLMGGRIWAQSEPSKGSTFFFTLPRFKETISQIPSAPRPVETESKRSQVSIVP